MFRFESVLVEVRLMPRTPSVALLVEGAFKSPIRLLKTLCVVPPEIMMPFVVALAPVAVRLQILFLKTF